MVERRHGDNGGIAHFDGLPDVGDSRAIALLGDGIGDGVVGIHHAGEFNFRNFTEDAGVKFAHSSGTNDCDTRNHVLTYPNNHVALAALGECFFFGFTPEGGRAT